MRRRGERVAVLRRGQRTAGCIAPFQAGGDPLELVARGDLCPAQPVDELPGAGLKRGSNHSAIGPQPLEARMVDRLERKRGLKALLGGSVELAGRFERPVAIELGAVALETERPLPFP